MKVSFQSYSTGQGTGKTKAALTEGHLILIKEVNMNSPDEMNKYLMSLLEAFTGNQLDTDLQILDPSRLTKMQTFIIGYLLERMQNDKFGDADKLENIRLYLLSELGKEK